MESIERRPKSEPKTTPSISHRNPITRCSSIRVAIPFQLHDDTVFFIVIATIAVRLFQRPLLPRPLPPSAARNHSLRCTVRRVFVCANPRASTRRSRSSAAGGQRLLRAAISGTRFRSCLEIGKIQGSEWCELIERVM